MSRDLDQAMAAARLVQRSGAGVESVVHGGSMGDTLPPGSRIRIIQHPEGSYEVGMVVGFMAGTTLVAHRVVRVCRDLRGRQALLTRGDASLVCDPAIAPEVVVGEVHALREGAGWGPPGPAPVRGLVASVFERSLLLAATALTRVDRFGASVFMEVLIRLGQGGRGAIERMRRLQGSSRGSGAGG